VRGVYDELNIRPQTEVLINQYFEDALLHLDRIGVPAARKEPLRRLALQLLERES
jgi:geranylgeranyl diphosphate synthase type II